MMSEDIEIVEDIQQNCEKNPTKKNADTFPRQEKEDKKRSDDIGKKLQQMFEITVSLDGIQFNSCHEEIYYRPKNEPTSFGENCCTLYNTNFKIFYFEFRLKILFLQYAESNEILKLELNVNEDNSKSPVATKELDSCFKAFRKRRNLNLLFKTLLNFTKAVESRRLIMLTVLQKHSGDIRLETNTDGGLILNYRNSKLNLRLGLFWSITVNSVNRIADFIHMYDNNLDAQSRSEIESILKSLAHPELHFITKYHLWKHLLSKLLKITKNLKRKHQSNTNQTSNISTSVIPSTSNETTYSSLNTAIGNMPPDAFRYLFSSMSPNVSYRYARYNNFLQSMFQPYSPLQQVSPQHLFRRQTEQSSSQMFTGNRFASGNNIPMFSFPGLLPTPDNASLSQASTTSQPSSLLSSDLEHSPRRASQRSRFHHKYHRHKNIGHSRFPHKPSNSLNFERGSAIPSSNSKFSKKRRGSERTRMVEPDVEIIDMSNPSSSQKISNFIKIQETQKIPSIETENNTMTDSVDVEPCDVQGTSNANLERVTATTVNNSTETQNTSLNNNVETVDVETVNSENNFSSNLITADITDKQCEIVKKSKKFNPFSLKFKDKLHKNGNNIQKSKLPEQEATNSECVLIVSDNENNLKIGSTKETLSKDDEKVVYVPD